MVIEATMKVARLTERQRFMLRAVIALIDEHGYPPTRRELGEATGISSTNAIQDHLKVLERKGYLVRAEGEGKVRTLRVLRDLDGRLYATKDEQIEQLRARVAELEQLVVELRGDAGLHARREPQRSLL